MWPFFWAHHHLQHHFSWRQTSQSVGQSAGCVTKWRFNLISKLGSKFRILPSLSGTAVWPGWHGCICHVKGTEGDALEEKLYLAGVKRAWSKPSFFFRSRIHQHPPTSQTSARGIEKIIVAVFTFLAGQRLRSILKIFPIKRFLPTHVRCCGIQLDFFSLQETKTVWIWTRSETRFKADGCKTSMPGCRDLRFFTWWRWQTKTCGCRPHLCEQHRTFFILTCGDVCKW